MNIRTKCLMATICFAASTFPAWSQDLRLWNKLSQLPTSFDALIQLHCDYQWQSIGELPQMTRDKLGGKLDKKYLCSCTSEASRKKLNSLTELNGYDRLFDLAKKYRKADFDSETEYKYYFMFFEVQGQAGHCFSLMLQGKTLQDEQNEANQRRQEYEAQRRQNAEANRAGWLTSCNSHKKQFEQRRAEACDSQQGNVRSSRQHALPSRCSFYVDNYRLQNEQLIKNCDAVGVSIIGR